MQLKYEPPEHVKEKILFFFLRTSVPRLIEKKREEVMKDDIWRNAEMDRKI